MFRADGFGIRPDREGYVHLMDLMGAILDEPDLAWVTVKDVGEAVASMPSLFEISGSRIRAIARSQASMSRGRLRRNRGGPPAVQPSAQAPTAEAKAGDAGAEQPHRKRRRRRRRRRGSGGPPTQHQRR